MNGRIIQYRNWLAAEQLEDTPERKEAFEAGWEWCKEGFRLDLSRLID
jgi:hypothetical protein